MEKNFHLIKAYNMCAILCYHSFLIHFSSFPFLHHFITHSYLCMSFRNFSKEEYFWVVEPYNLYSSISVLFIF